MHSYDHYKTASPAGEELPGATQGSRLLLQTLTNAAERAERRVSINPIYTAAADLLKSLAAMPIPRIPVEPEPGDLQEIGLHLLDFAARVDRYILTVGEELDRNSPPCGFDMSCFTRVLTSAIEGNATFEAEKAAQALREERS